jgi:hypothetical protein
MEELIRYLDNTKALVYVSIASVGLTFITHFIFKKYRFVKYIPGIGIIGFGLYSLYQVMNLLTESKSIENLLLFLLCVVGGFVGLLFALIIGIYNKPKRKKKSKKEDNIDIE